MCKYDLNKLITIKVVKISKEETENFFISKSHLSQESGMKILPCCKS